MLQTQKLGTMNSHTAEWRVLVLLAFSAAFSRAVEQLTLTSMTWSGSSPLGPDLAVCATQDLDPSGTIELSVLFSNGSQSIFLGELGNEANCAMFTEMIALPRPEANTTTYILHLSNDAELLQQGIATFAYPFSATPWNTVDCGFAKFSRIVNGSGDPGAATCLPGVTEPCYVTANDLEAPCVPGLDQNNPDFKVCVTSGDTLRVTEEIIEVTLTYATAPATGGTFTITTENDMSAYTLELLSRIKDDNDSVRVAACDANACFFDVGSPSQNKYELCGVFVTSTNNVASVATFQFQDLDLGAYSDGNTVNFRLANLGYEGDYVYNVYGGDAVPNLITDGLRFTFDCSNVDAGSFCNGFFDNPLPAFVGVSFASYDVNKVITPVTSGAGVKNKVPAPAFNDPNTARKKRL